MGIEENHLGYQMLHKKLRFTSLLLAHGSPDLFGNALRKSHLSSRLLKPYGEINASFGVYGI